MDSLPNQGEAMETFVRSQKKFLDVIPEETAHATATTDGKATPKKPEAADLARQAAEALRPLAGNAAYWLLTLARNSHRSVEEKGSSRVSIRARNYAMRIPV